MSKKYLLLALLILGFGFWLKILATSNGHFLFNMDNARDLVDVREMVVLHKLRLTGPTSAIEGVFDGPAWYYLLAIPFVLSGGNPYSEVILMIVLWAIGGFFLIKLMSRFGFLTTIAVGLLWISSNIVNLATTYSFNPNPSLLLSPLFIYLLEMYLRKKNLLSSLLLWTLAGLFFNFEMNPGLITPFIIIGAILVSRQYSSLKSRNFWLGVFMFGLFVVPQILFDIKHQFIMTKSLIQYLTISGGSGASKDPLIRIEAILQDFVTWLSPVLMNYRFLAYIFIVICLVVLGNLIKGWKLIKDSLLVATLAYVVIPIIYFILVPTVINMWHWGPVTVGTVILTFVCLSYIKNLNFISRIGSFLFLIIIVVLSLNGISKIIQGLNQPNNDPSIYANEIAAIDYVYSQAQGQDFKVYTFMPSVIDYPYQYLIWWYGQKKFGYLPVDYAYAPDKPQYISNKESFNKTNDYVASAMESSTGTRKNTGLVFLIKEPDGNNTRVGWENQFKGFKSLSRAVVGSIEIEIKQATPSGQL